MTDRRIVLPLPLLPIRVIGGMGHDGGRSGGGRRLAVVGWALPDRLDAGGANSPDCSIEAASDEAEDSPYLF